jgi:NADPH:quinone reductase-like Zn-dependent oxidoreductase
MFGMADYKLPEELAKLSSEKDASYKFIFMHPNGSQLSEIKSLVEDDKLKPIIDKVYSFSESIEEFVHLATGRAKGKIVIKMS